MEEHNVSLSPLPALPLGRENRIHCQPCSFSTQATNFIFGFAAAAAASQPTAASPSGNTALTLARVGGIMGNSWAGQSLAFDKAVGI